MFKLATQFISLCQLNVSRVEILKQRDDKVVGRMVKIARGICYSCERIVASRNKDSKNLKFERCRANEVASPIRGEKEVNLRDVSHLFHRSRNEGTLAKRTRQREREKQNRKRNALRYDQSSGE